MVTKFLDGLDRIYSSGDMEQAEQYLQDGLERAVWNQDTATLLTLLNELMGLYRVSGQYDKCLLCIEQAISIAELLNVTETPEYGTTLLNAATSCCAAKHYDKSEKYYQQAERIFAQLPPTDYRLASLYNNRSILYAETDRLSLAKKELTRAMEIISQCPDTESEIAITHVNIGNICFRMRALTEGISHMEQAIELFEQNPDRKDAHYASALSGLGEAWFHKNDLEQSIIYYKKSLREIERTYGQNDDYRTVLNSLNTVVDLQRRRRLVREHNITGLELCRQYYEQFGKPMLQERFPDYINRIAVGLVGFGSECLGFDDEYSSDHDYGPGFCIWLTAPDYMKIGAELHRAYDELPKNFCGLERNTTSFGYSRIGVMEIGSFFQKMTGFTDAPKKMEDWEHIPFPILRTLTSGLVFNDPLGEFSRRRNAFLNYPESLWCRRLADAIGRMGQAGQYNILRALQRKDAGAAYLSLSEFISGTIEAGYLLNKLYPPFYKWQMRGMETFTCLTELKPLLEKLMRIPAEDDTVQEKIEEICAVIVLELKKQSLSGNDNLFMEVQKQEILKHLDR